MDHDAATSKDGVTGFFSQAASTFGRDDFGIRRFQHFGRRLVEVASLPVGGRVLDVATGRGAVLFPAAERVGPMGSVLGIDITPGMVEATAREIAERGMTNAEARVMDAEALDLPAGSFDAVTCGFGVMFFPDLARALAAIRQALKPGGIVAISTWADPDPRYAWDYEMWRDYGIWERHPAHQMAQRLSTPAEVSDVLEIAGFSDIRVLAETDVLHHADAAEWWERTMSLGPARASVESLGPERAAQFKQEAFARLAALAGSTGLIQQVTANFGLARNP